MPLIPSQIYQQSIDKQRIVITGAGRHIVASIISHVLKSFGRKFDYVSDNQSGPTSADAPVMLIESEQPSTEFQHHILLMTSDDRLDKKSAEDLANATPKGGIIIYPENNAVLKAIGSKERADVQSIPYKTYKHEIKEGKTILITSTNEKFPIQLNGESNLEYISAAKELLKKIGITSSQFYKGVTSYHP